MSFSRFTCVVSVLRHVRLTGINNPRQHCYGNGNNKTQTRAATRHPLPSCAENVVTQQTGQRTETMTEVSLWFYIDSALMLLCVFVSFTGEFGSSHQTLSSVSELPLSGWYLQQLWWQPVGIIQPTIIYYFSPLFCSSKQYRAITPPEMIQQHNLHTDTHTADRRRWMSCNQFLKTS